MDHDEACLEKGIPEHLHQCKRESVPFFDANELLFRRITLPCEDFTARVSFNRKNSSVNRDKFSSPDDARWDVEKGVYHKESGVISFPADAFKNREWHTDEKTPVRFRLNVFHDPMRCNYSHTDFHFVRDEQEVQEIKPKSVKMKIREFLAPLIEQVA